ncbi:hypothetical protein [Kitasatospora sp. NBC_01266]|uniref:hypothetical protein n=1 Tax=Kitasatospora sp. NBC_01266 TaxID=2903572 RepID=UPI002E36DC8C|nr:hypothetical protein [Kitasatospora sp. NBC_01266]
MSTRRTPPPTLYTPQPNELVRDAKHHLTGHYMGPGFGKHPTVFLRPPGGGCEWETPASEIQPLIEAPELRAVRAPVRPREGSA